MAADMVLGFDHDHRRTGLARHDGRWQAGRTGSDDDDVGLAIPTHCICHFGLFRLDCGRDTNSIADFVSLGVAIPRFMLIELAALIAWMLVVRVDDLVKDGAISAVTRVFDALRRRRLRRSSILDKIINTNTNAVQAIKAAFS